MSQITLAAARVNARLSQKYVADVLGVSTSTVRNWENGSTFPKQPMIEKMCELYGVTYNQIDFEPRK